MLSSVLFKWTRAIPLAVWVLSSAEVSSSSQVYSESSQIQPPRIVYNVHVQHQRHWKLDLYDQTHTDKSNSSAMKKHTHKSNSSRVCSVNKAILAICRFLHWCYGPRNHIQGSLNRLWWLAVMVRDIVSSESQGGFIQPYLWEPGKKISVLVSSLMRGLVLSCLLAANQFQNMSFFLQ